MGMLLFGCAVLAGTALVFVTGSPQPGMAGYESRDVNLGTIALACLGSLLVVALAVWLALLGGAL